MKKMYINVEDCIEINFIKKVSGSQRFYSRANNLNYRRLLNYLTYLI